MAFSGPSKRKKSTRWSDVACLTACKAVVKTCEHFESVGDLDGFRLKLVANYQEILGEYELHGHTIPLIDKERNHLSIISKYRLARENCVRFQFHLEQVWGMGISRGLADEDLIRIATCSFNKKEITVGVITGVSSSSRFIGATFRYLDVYLWLRTTTTWKYIMHDLKLIIEGERGDEEPVFDKVNKSSNTRNGLQIENFATLVSKEFQRISSASIRESSVQAGQNSTARSRVRLDTISLQESIYENGDNSELIPIMLREIPPADNDYKEKSNFLEVNSGYIISRTRTVLADSISTYLTCSPAKLRPCLHLSNKLASLREYPLCFRSITCTVHEYHLFESYALHSWRAERRASIHCEDGFRPACAIVFCSYMDLMRSIGVQREIYEQLLVRHYCIHSTGERYTIIIAPLLKSADRKDQCLLFRGNVLKLGTEKVDSVCANLPETQWWEGDWKRDFLPVHGNTTGACPHWCHSNRIPLKVQESFRIEWSPSKDCDEVGEMRVVLPAITLRGEKAKTLLDNSLKPLYGKLTAPY